MCIRDRDESMSFTLASPQHRINIEVTAVSSSTPSTGSSSGASDGTSRANRPDWHELDVRSAGEDDEDEDLDDGDGEVQGAIGGEAMGALPVFRDNLTKMDR